MRQIKASEVKPGMEVEIVTTRKMTVDRVFTWDDSDRELRDNSGHVARVNSDAKITVLSEPQPEEPTEFGARVVVDGQQFLRAPEGEDDHSPWLKAGVGDWHDWDGLLRLGRVEVVPDQGWTVPADTPDVPDWIKEWPKDDAALCKHKWVDGEGEIWRCVDGRWQWGDGPWGDHDTPLHGPWERETDEPTPEVPERIEEWPKDDAHLREQRWRDRGGTVWSSRDGQWGYHSFTMGWVGLVTTRCPFDGPWVRVP